MLDSGVLDSGVGWSGCICRWGCWPRKDYLTYLNKMMYNVCRILNGIKQGIIYLLLRC